MKVLVMKIILYINKYVFISQMRKKFHILKQTAYVLRLIKIYLFELFKLQVSIY